MSTVEDTIKTLTEMGFSEAKAKKALTQTGWSGVEQAMEWLLSHPDDDGAMDEDEMAEAEAAAEPEPPKKELTPEEKAEQLERLEKLRVKKRKEREEKEKQEAIEREKKRIIEGKAITGLKQTLEEQEMKKIAAERRREKIETQKAKERVKAQIAADRAAQKEREAKERGIVPNEPAAPAPVQATATPAPVVNHTEAKIQIKQTDGKPLVQTFKAKETLSAVRLYAQLNRKDQPGAPVNFMTAFPRKVFNEEDYEQPLEVLGLVPSAVLLMK